MFVIGAIFISGEMMSDWFLKGATWLFSLVIASSIGSLVTYYFTRRRDNKIDEKKEKDELNGISHAICFSLALQQSELTRLIMNIKDRKQLLGEIKKSGQCPENLKEIGQDFELHKNININLEYLSKILAAGKSKRGIVEVMQCIFISNNHYLENIEMLERYQQFKKSIPENENFFNYMLGFLESNLPQYEKSIEKSQSFGKQTIDSFRAMMIEKFKIKIEISLGEIVKIS